MAEINTWWKADPNERYWLEITGRTNLGADLSAPKLDDGGRAYWSYNLVTEVRAGDVVLHWHKDLMGEPGIVGWSVAVGTPLDTSIVWQSRGTYGRQFGPTGEEPAWEFGLEDFTPLLAPVTQTQLRQEEPVLRKVHAELTARYRGPVYFPFAFSNSRPVRTAQGYLVKFPAELLNVFRELDTVPRPEEMPLVSRSSTPVKTSGGNSGYENDPRVRLALERRSVRLATESFEQQGYSVENVGNQCAWDLEVTRRAECRRVEVKGSSGTAVTVELTTGEIRNAQQYQPTDLFIVDKIQWYRQPDGSLLTDGGRERIFPGWSPAQQDLTPTKYRYRVP